MAKKTGPNIFTFLNQIFYKTTKVEYDKKLAPAYLLSLWLSHDPKLIDIVQELNRLQFRLPDDIIYQYYFSKVPKGRRFLKWTKKEISKKKEKQIEELKIEYNLSTKGAMKLFSVIERLERG